MMLNLIHSSAQLESAIGAISELVRAGREKFATILPGDQHNFDAICWDVGSLKDRSAKSGTRKLYFTRYGTLDQPLPVNYAEVIKSWIILDGKSITNMIYRLDAARILWEVILIHQRGRAESFRWIELSEQHLSQAEQMMHQQGAISTTYRMANYLLLLGDFLAARAICRPLYYTLQTPRPEGFDRHTIAGQEARRAKLPSKQALEGLARIYNLHAKEPPDRLRAAALAILVVTGFRVGELLTMPEDCEVEEVRNGKLVYGLRYYNEKSRGGDRMYAVRWLTTIGAELARKALAEIREITAEVRARARVLEQSPNTVRIPGFQGIDRMERDDVMKALGLTHRTTLNNISNDRLPHHREGKRFFYRAFEVEAYLLSVRVDRLWTIDRRDGTHQMLSDTLLKGRLCPRSPHEKIGYMLDGHGFN